MQKSNIVLTAIAAMCGVVLFAFTASATTIDPSNYEHSMTIRPAAGKGGKGFTIDEIDLSKLPGNFGGVKHDDNSDANARQEGFI